jgi:hypothetical protein
VPVSSALVPCVSDRESHKTPSISVAFRVVRGSQASGPARPRNAFWQFTTRPMTSLTDWSVPLVKGNVRLFPFLAPLRVNVPPFTAGWTRVSWMAPISAADKVRVK